MVNNALSFADSVTESREGRLRLTLLGAALARKLDKAGYDQYLDQLAAADPDAAFAAGIAAAKNTTYDQTPQLSFDTFSRQLLWAATLLRLATVAAEERRNFSETPFFRHIVNQPIFQQELLRYAQVLSEHFDSNRTRIRIGAPLSWFYFSPQEKLINLDPFHMLVFGMPRYPQDDAHSRAPAYHEVFHAILSRQLPPSFQGAVDLLEKLGKKSSLTAAEQEEFLDKRIEAMLWSQFYNLAEDNPVNRSTVILGRYVHGQNYDYAKSLKYIYALINQSRKSFEDFRNDQWAAYVRSGKDFLDKLKVASPIEQFSAICKVLGVAVPVNEGLFANRKTDWEKSGLNWSAFMPTLDNAGKITAAATLLAEGDGALDSVSYQQPYIERVLQSAKPGNLASTIDDMAKRFFRYLTLDNSVIHSSEAVERANKTRNEVIERLWQKYVLPLLPEIKAEIKRQMRQAQQSMQQMADQIPGPPSSGMGTPGQGQQQDKQDQGKPKSSDKGKQADKESTNDKSASKQKKQEKDKDENKGESLKEVLEGAQKQAADDKKRQGEQEGQLRSAIQQTQQGAQTIDYDFPEGDFANHQETERRLMWLVGVYYRQLEDIRKKSIEQRIVRSKRLVALRDDRDMSDMDSAANFQLIGRVLGGVERADDFKRFEDDKIATQSATIQIVALTDGSGSMEQRMDGSSGPKPITVANCMSVAMNKAASLINSRVSDPHPAFEFYNGIWGPDNPTWLTYPGIDPVEAGRNFDRFSNGLQSRTNLAPALGMIAEKLSHANSPAKNIGGTHVLILSDGDIQDAEQSKAQVIKLVENVRNLTVDIILISARQDSQIVHVFRELKTQYPKLNYAVHEVGAVEQLPFTCLRALRQRLTQPIVATPQAAKAMEFKRAGLG